MTLIELYEMQKANGDVGKKAKALLAQTHWFTVNAEFDPKTGEALPQALSAFLAKVADPKPNGRMQDRLYRITEHARPSLERLFRTLNESPRREHALLPVRAVRELDASSFIKLSMRPGRNIREKLAGKPYLQAVRRYQSVDLAENRLLKAYACRLADLLEFRREYLNETEAPLLPKIRSWIISDAAKAIGRWENLPPNNTLLSHRDYRRVWDSWRRLQTLDSYIARDLSRLDERHDTMQRWSEYALIYREGTHLFADMPVLFDYEKLTIQPWGQAEPLLRKAPRRIIRSYGEKRVAEPACVDLAELRPRFAVSSQGSQALNETYLWQQWDDEKKSVIIHLFDSDAAFLHPASTSIASADIFFSSDDSDERRKCLDRAGHEFASKLRQTFCDDTLVWLVSDFLNDFQLGIIRRNLNAHFPNAQPLPRSVAAVFEQVDYSRIRRDGYTILVVDTVRGITTATKLIARFDSELKKRVPETNGYCWEHCPPVILSHREAGESLAKDRHYDMITVDGNGDWHKGSRTDRSPSIDAKSLKNDQRVGDFHDCINISESPVAGGMRLYTLQALAKGIPLWREQIPELSIKGYVDGFWRRFYLIDKYTPVPPIRGTSISIKINTTFPLSAGKRDYSFPLFRGGNGSALGFEAHLKSTAFPRKLVTVCKLHLTYTYGDDEPYKLIFEPLDGSFAAVRAKLQRPDVKIITDALAPEYPKPMTWESLRVFPDIKRGGTIDLTHNVASTVRNFDRWLELADDESWDKIKNNIEGWCRFLLFSAWGDGRSVADAECPTECRYASNEMIAILIRIYSMPNKQRHGITTFSIMTLLSSMHKDMPDECVSWVTDQAEKGNLSNARAIGFALGDVSEQWQKYLLDLILDRIELNTLCVLAYAVWREINFVHLFSISEVHRILDRLLEGLTGVQLFEMNSGRKITSEGYISLRHTVELLELLLGILRLRASKNPEIKMLLQPHQKITKQFAEQIDRIEDLIAESNINLFSRVQINIQKPDGVRTPDLLYALRLYLTGDDGANAIHITGISDNDDD